MAEIEKDVEALKGRVNKLENIAYILGGLAVVLGLAGASLFGKLSNAKNEAEVLRGQTADLSREVNDGLRTKVDTVIHERFASIVKEWRTPWLSPPISAGGTTTKKAEFCALGSLSTYIDTSQTDAHCELSLDPNTKFWTLSGRRKDDHINLRCQMVCFGV